MFSESFDTKIMKKLKALQYLGKNTFLFKNVYPKTVSIPPPGYGAQTLFNHSLS